MMARSSYANGRNSSEKNCASQEKSWLAKCSKALSPSLAAATLRPVLPPGKSVPEPLSAAKPTLHRTSRRPVFDRAPTEATALTGSSDRHKFHINIARPGHIRQEAFRILFASASAPTRLRIIVAKSGDQAGFRLKLAAGAPIRSPAATLVRTTDRDLRPSQPDRRRAPRPAVPAAECRHERQPPAACSAVGGPSR